MRNYVMGMLVSACMLSRSVFGSGFCDPSDLPLPPKGSTLGSGHCHQTRTTGANGIASPSYSDLDMSAYWSDPNVPISFTFDVSRLYRGVSLYEQHVEVLELGLGQFSQGGSEAGNASGEHVLTITVHRLPTGEWSLGYAWLAAPSNWSIVSGTFEPNVEAGGDTALFMPHVTSIVVNIVPTDGWQHLVVSAQPSGADRLAGGPPSEFDMPPIPTASLTRPVRLRTGVLGGDLVSAIETKYLFTSPYIGEEQ